MIETFRLNDLEVAIVIILFVILAINLAILSRGHPKLNNNHRTVVKIGTSEKIVSSYPYTYKLKVPAAGMYTVIIDQEEAS